MTSLRQGLALAALFLMGPSVLGYTIVRRNGTRIKVRDAPTYQDGTAYFVLLNGLFAFMPEEDVDRARTEQANAPRSRREGKSRKAQAPAPPRVYTNDDLEKAEGLSVVEGDVTAAGKEAPPTTEAASRTAPPPGAPAGPSSPTAAPP